MNIQIREAAIDDLQTVQNFNAALSRKEHDDFDDTVNPDFVTTYTGERYFTHSINNDDRLVLLAEIDNKAVGYLVCNIEQVSTYRNIDTLCEVDNMWVEEAYRNQRIGAMMLERAQKWSSDHGVKRMRVIASALNTQAIEFYKREHFHEYDVILEKDIA